MSSPATSSSGAVSRRRTGTVPLRARKPEAPATARNANDFQEVAKRNDGGVVAACKAAARDCAFVMMGFAHITPTALFKSTRGAADEAFPRQIMMALLVSELGFSSLTVGRAIGRDKATVEHACRIIEAIRGGIEPDHLIDILGPAGVQDFLGGFDGAETFLDAAESLIDDFGVAFRLVAIKGGAYRRDVARRKAEAANKGD